MYHRLIDYCNQIITTEQYGLQKEKNTILPTFNLLKIILTNINNNFLSTGLFFYFSKAFDYVSHDLLLQKLEEIRIRGPALRWLSSYLDNRLQCVTVTKLQIKTRV